MNCNSHTRGAARALLISAAMTASLAAGVAVAQEQPAAPPADVITEVVITGSRIATPNATSTSPIQVVTEQQIKLQDTLDKIMPGLIPLVLTLFSLWLVRRGWNTLWVMLLLVGIGAVAGITKVLA